MSSGIRLLLAVLSMAASAAVAAAAPTRVIVLGVDHAAQLVSEADQPAVLAAFIDQVAPDAICIERAPEAFARNDHYEFTYEIQDVVVPMARARRIALCPFDWMPPDEDERLGFGMSVSQPLEVRRASGFQGFLAFPDAAARTRRFFHADDRANLAQVDAWARTASDAATARHDLPRRLFLYRTFLQAQRIAAAARAHPGGTVLVVVGEFHKHDIEDVLSGAADITLVQPSSLGLPAAEQIDAHDSRVYRLAIARFNVLGAQAATGNVDHAWVARVIAALAAENDDAEVELLRIRHARLTGAMTPEAAVAAYCALAVRDDAHRAAGWDGVLDRSRVDAYFDPFGNLRVDQRARVELARELAATGDAAGAEALRVALTGELTPRQARQFDAYWAREIVAAD